MPRLRRVLSVLAEIVLIVRHNISDALARYHVQFTAANYAYQNQHLHELTESDCYHNIIVLQLLLRQFSHALDDG